MPKHGGLFPPPFPGNPLRLISWRWLKMVHGLVGLAVVLLIGSVVMVILSHPKTPGGTANMGLMVVTESSGPTRMVVPNLTTGRVDVVSRSAIEMSESNREQDVVERQVEDRHDLLNSVVVDGNGLVLTFGKVPHAVSMKQSVVSGVDSEALMPMFNGRPLRKVKTLSMKVTAYSPDARSCGAWADGQTASGYSVWTNGMKLVAADTRLLPFGSIISIPGYHGGRPVPVLDRGGKIKGHRLDVLYPTHEIALQWGVQDVVVDVWEYADELMSQ